MALATSGERGGQEVRRSEGQHRISFIEVGRANGLRRVPPFHKLDEEKEAAGVQDIYARLALKGLGRRY